MCTNTLYSNSFHVHLHEVLLCLVHTGNISESDASVCLHLELCLALSKCHGVVASLTSHATLALAREQEQTTNQQEGECKVACKWAGTLLNRSAVCQTQWNLVLQWAEARSIIKRQHDVEMGAVVLSHRTCIQRNKPLSEQVWKNIIMDINSKGSCVMKERSHFHMFHVCVQSWMEKYDIVIFEVRLAVFENVRVKFVA